MLLNRIRKLPGSFRFRIAASYFGLVIVTAVIVFGFIYFLIAQTLREKDKQIIESEYKRFSLIAVTDGTAGFDKWLAQRAGSENRTDIFLRLTDSGGRTLFQHDPAILNEIGHAVFQDAIEHAKDDSLVRVEAPDDFEDAVEFKTGRLSNELRLQVGKATEDREELLEKFRDAFGVTLLGALITAVISGLIFSRAIARPIGNLSETINRVRRGDLKARARMQESGGEFDELAQFLNGMLDQNAKLISALTASLDAVAHDLRTPLTKLRALAERALQSNQPASDTIRKEALGEILENTDQIIDLINAIFDMSEAEAGAMKLTLRPYGARQFIGEIVDVYSLVAEDKSIRIAVDIPTDFRFRSDVRLKQAVANLIDNAIKFSPSSTNVTVHAASNGHVAEISILDEGPGIPAEERQRIWERLYRGDQSRSTRGMGLGLSLVRAIVSAHGGEVESEISPTGTGSVFKLKIPVI